MKALLTLSKTFYNAYSKMGIDIEKLGIALEKIISDSPVDKKTLIDKIKDKEIYIVGVEKVDREVIDAAKQLKLITKHGAGLDNLDLEYLTKKGVIVTYTPGQNSSSVADFTMALLLAIARNVTQADKLLKQNKWQLLMGYELENKTLGILGLGSIGQKVARRAKGFGMNVIAYDIYKDNEKAKEIGVCYKELDDLITKSDFISLNMALTEKTNNMIDLSKLKKMKSNAIIVNTSRGPIISEADLIYALKNNIIRGAALDVFNMEPPNKELVSLPNVVASCHIGGSTYECAKRLGDITVLNLKKYLNNEDLIYVANPQVINYKV